MDNECEHWCTAGGSSDPYVKLTLLPQCKFPESSKKQFKTQVVKATLDPYFDRDFLLWATNSIFYKLSLPLAKLSTFHPLSPFLFFLLLLLSPSSFPPPPHRPASADNLSIKGSVLLLSFYDYDIITSNDFMGMCVIPLHSLPGLPSLPPPDQNAPRRKNLTLPLFELSEEMKSRAALELVSRSQKGDPRAVGFLKENKKIIGAYFKKLFKDWCNEVEELLYKYPDSQPHCSTHVSTAFTFILITIYSTL